METDAEHLKLLSIFHFVLAGLSAVAGCFPFLHVFVGVTMLQGRFPGGTGPAPPKEFAWLFIVIASVVILLSWTMALLALLAGRRLSARRGHTFCMVVAGLECLLFPLGTILGVFTLVVLSRDSVKRSFDAPG